MPDLAIKVEGLSKRYRIGQYVGGGMYQYRTLRDFLTDAMYAPFRRLRARSKQQVVGSNPTTMTHEPSADFIWALKDVSFEVKQGEVVGIIGKNGAGKSTLLKLLSRITEPTEGRAEVKGRLGSLLEVGTGFHPELTGRENVYLSGAILGMTKKEIDRKFDEIVDFSGVEKFIDTPVKRYSSGMCVRLGFAVAAHLEPEILLVDEVLAVGDAAFQKKCLGKMEDVAKEGRTVLFVSHNMDAIVRLCTKGMLLQDGKLILVGLSDQVVAHYLSAIEELSNTFVIDYSRTPLPEGPAYVLSGEIYQKGALHSSTGVMQGVLFSKPWSIKIRYRVTKYMDNVTCGIRIIDDRERFVLNTGECFTEEMQMTRIPGDYEAICHVPAGLILPGTYSLDVGLDIVGGLCIQGLRGLVRWTIINDDPILGRFQDRRLVGVIGSKITPWTTQRLEDSSHESI